MEVSLPFLHLHDGCAPPLTALAMASQGGKGRHVPELCAGLDLGGPGHAPLKGRKTMQNNGFPGTLKDAVLSARSTFPLDVQGDPKGRGPTLSPKDLRESRASGSLPPVAPSPPTHTHTSPDSVGRSLPRFTHQDSGFRDLKCRFFLGDVSGSGE